MRRLIAIALLMAACGGGGTAQATRAPAPTEDPAIVACRSDVQHGNLNAQDITALDFAIHDCPSLAALKAAIAAAPGYLDAGVAVETFVRNRCDDPKAVFAGLKNPVCDQTPPLQ